MAQTKYFLYKWSVRKNDTLYCLAVEVDKQETREMADQMILTSQTESPAIRELQAFLKGEPNRLRVKVIVREFDSLEAIQWAIARGA